MGTPAIKKAIFASESFHNGDLFEMTNIPYDRDFGKRSEFHKKGKDNNGKECI